VPHPDLAEAHEEPRRQPSSRRPRAANRAVSAGKTSAASLGLADSTAGYPPWATRAMRR
jgi:hypothetical protein